MNRPRIPIDTLLEKCKKVIIKEIAEKFREEAKEIMAMTTDKHRKDFIDYAKKDQGNICCLVLDAAKRDLIAESKMTLNEGDVFGKPFKL